MRKSRGEDLPGTPTAIGRHAGPWPGQLTTGRYTTRTQNLRAVTKGIRKRVEERSCKSIQFMRDEKLPLLAKMQMARHGANFHVHRYRPSNEPLDYVIAYQAGFVLRLFQNEPDRRFDFSPSTSVAKNAEVLLTTGQPLGETEPH